MSGYYSELAAKVRREKPCLSLRDHAAIEAMAVLMSSGTWTAWPVDIAHRAYEIADAMLAERDKQ